MASKHAIPAAEKNQIYLRFVRAKLKPSEFPEFCETLAEELGRGITARDVRKWIAELDEAEQFAIKAAHATEAQRTAALVGASKRRALSVLNDALEAENEKQLHDRDGNPTSVHKTPAWEARISAAEKILKVHGGFAPDRVDVTVTNEEDPLNWDDARIEAELGKLREGQRALTAPRAADAPSTKGPLLLADGMHKDEGRAGSDRGSVQAVPE